MSAAATGTPSSGNWGSKAMVWFASIVSAVGAAALGLVGQFLLTSYQTQQTQKASTVASFVDVSQQFDRKVAEYMTPFLKGADVKVQREALRKNIQDQFLAIEQASGILPPKESSRAMVYKDALVRVDAELSEERPAAQARELVQAIADARDSNVCVTFYLKSEVGMPVSDDDADYCKEGNKPSLKAL